MFIRAPEAHSRSFIKAVSWRLLGSLDTFIISFFITHRFTAAASIASVETFTKILLFYGHERVWTAVPWGRGKLVEVEDGAEAAPTPLVASASQA
jgi:uncharacterized membrane protein